MAKSKIPSVDISGYHWATGQFTEPKASPANPDMSKMPAMKPMASHATGAKPQELRRGSPSGPPPSPPQQIQKRPMRDLGPSTERPLLKRLAPKRRMSGDR